MEVHHHPDLHHNKKQFKGYFLEFVMIFLAVTLGFVSENLRENFVEHEHAGTMAKAFLNDLKEDTSALSLLISFRDQKTDKLNNLMNELEKPVNKQNDSLIAQLSEESITSRKYFESESGTYEQIKNSGSLRYYSLDAQQLMIKYEQSMAALKLSSEVENKFVMEQIMPSLLGGLNAKFLHAIENKKEYKSVSPLRRNDTAFKDDLYSYANYICQRTKVIRRHMTEVKSNAINLINMLNKKYND
jgi:hypothetical protein